MKKLIPTAVMVGCMTLAGCGAVGKAQGNSGGGVPSNEVDMASVTFVQKSVIIKAGQQVKFVDPAATGAFHTLCFGHNQVCIPNANGPTALNVASGIPVNAGDPAMFFTFTKPGTYEVTCTVHPAMNVIVTVQ
jgi:plastocyanin